MFKKKESLEQNIDELMEGKYEKENNFSRKQLEKEQNAGKITLSKYLIYILLSSVMIGLGYGAYYFLEQQKITQENLNKIQQLETEVDRVFSGTIIEDIDIEKTISEIQVSSGSIFTDLDIDFDDDNLSDLKESYSKAILKQDEKLQFKLLEKIYEQTNQPAMEELLFEKSLDLYDFHSALKYMKLIQSHDSELSEGDVETYLYVLFNSFEFDFEHIKTLRSIVEAYNSRGVLSNDQYLFHKSLLDLSMGETDQFIAQIATLTGETYQSFVNDVNFANVESNKYKDVAEYYQDSLIAFVLMQHGYFNLAKKIAINVLKQNKEYILPNQVVAYSSFVINDFETAQKYLRVLIEIDEGNQDIYNLFMGVTYFWNMKYYDAIIFLSQIKQSENLLDVYRYLVISYYNIEDYGNVSKYLEKMLEMNPLNEYDFYTIFDITFYKPFEENKGFDLFEDNSGLFVKFIKKCDMNLTNESKYICSYGKAGVFLAKENVDKTLKYLLLIEDKFDRNYIYEKIGDLYFQKGETKKAKSYFIKSIFHTQDEKEKQKIKEKLFDLILKKSEK